MAASAKKYEYVTYGSTPPDNIYITMEKNRKTYAGTVTIKYVFIDKANDKYTE